MLKVVAVVDKEKTALDRLAQGVKPYHDNLDYTVCRVHPKRPDDEQLILFEHAARDADIIDFQYFRSALMLIERYPWLKEKKLILTHNNPYSIYEQKWEEFDAVVANNETMHKDLLEHCGRSKHIPLAVDPLFWEYNREWKPNKTIMMVANRIESKKGILEVATAAGNLGLKFVLVGAISDRNYFNDILQTGHVEFHEQISDEQLRDLYHKATILVVNSIDNFESGTLPILEAMLCGVPVLTRRVGHVPDLDNGENLRILESQPEEVMPIMAAIEDMLADSKRLETQRGVAWNTAKNFNYERRAYLYQRLYRETLYPNHPPVSIVTPIFDKPETIRACLNAIANQTYPNIELIVADDNPGEPNQELVAEFARTVSFPVRYIRNFWEEKLNLEQEPTIRQQDYGLARARNIGIIEATGEVIVFCDQRMIMQSNAVEELVKAVEERIWVYGEKGTKRDFVENFSAVLRNDIIRMGMFSERMDRYGGLSQYARSMARLAGIKTLFVESAKATPMGKSSNKNTKRKDIVVIKNRLWKMGL